MRCSRCPARSFGRDTQVGPLQQIEDLGVKGHQIAYVGDVVGTDPREVCDQLRHVALGDDIPYVPNKRSEVCIGGKIAPVFYNTIELRLCPSRCGRQLATETSSTFSRTRVTSPTRRARSSAVVPESDVLLDEVRKEGASFHHWPRPHARARNPWHGAVEIFRQAASVDGSAVKGSSRSKMVEPAARTACFQHLHEPTMT